MQSPLANSLSGNGNDDDRIGPNKQNTKHRSSAIEIEKLALELCPLPMSFDVQPIQRDYFTEFTYFDLFGGIFLQAMSPEVQARALEYAVDNASLDGVKPVSYPKRDKYEDLKDASQLYDKVIFLPGGNLAYSLDRSKMDEIMFNDPEIMIKAHPVTAKDYIRFLGNNYGYGRVIDPNTSGYAIYDKCTHVWSGANSELGIMAAFDKKVVNTITHTTHVPKSTYACLYRLLRYGEGHQEHNYHILQKAFTAKNSGIIMPWANIEDMRENITAYFDTIMEMRTFFKPSYAGLMFVPNTPKD